MAIEQVIQITTRSWSAADDRKFKDDELRLNAGIGKLVRRWSLLHDRFAEIFHYAVADGNEISMRPSVGHAIWHSIKSDLQQRKILKAALKTKIELKQKYNWPTDQSVKIKQYEEYIWLLNEVDIKAGARNDFVHAPIIFSLELFASEYEATISDMASDPRAKKLAKQELYQQCSCCIDFCERALKYIHDVSHYMNPSPVFPERPKWAPISDFPTRTQRPSRGRTRVKYRIIRTSTPPSEAAKPPEA